MLHHSGEAFGPPRCCFNQHSAPVWGTGSGAVGIPARSVGTMNPLIPNAFEVIVFYVFPLIVTVVLAIVVYKLIKGSAKPTNHRWMAEDQDPGHDSQTD